MKDCDKICCGSDWRNPAYGPCQILWTKMPDLLVRPLPLMVMDVTWATVPGGLAGDRHEPWTMHAVGNQIALRVTRRLRSIGTLVDPLVRTIWLNPVQGCYGAIVEDASFDQVRAGEELPLWRLEHEEPT